MKKLIRNTEIEANVYSFRVAAFLFFVMSIIFSGMAFSCEQEELEEAYTQGAVDFVVKCIEMKSIKTDELTVICVQTMEL